MNSWAKKTLVIILTIIFFLSGQGLISAQVIDLEKAPQADCEKANKLMGIVNTLDVLGGLKTIATNEIKNLIGDIFGSTEDKFKEELEKNIQNFEKKMKEKFSKEVQEQTDKLIKGLRDKALGIVSTEVPVKDTAVEEAIKEVKATIENVEKNTQKREAIKKTCENKLKTAMERVKILLLDHVTNQIIEWITNEQKPKMITDWWGFFRDVRDEAVGSVIQELAPRLCSPFRTQVLISLEQPVFVHQVSCTLTQVVQNIEDFYQNFESGGWLGYQTVWKPQNNYYGALLLAHDELITRQAEEQEAATQEAQANKGFQSAKICEVWELIPFKGTGVIETRGPTPDNERPTDFPFGYDATNSVWTCIKKKVVEPGLTAAEAMVKAANKDIDAIQNASDIEPYISAIIDAVINWATRRAVDGLKARLK